MFLSEHTLTHMRFSLTLKIYLEIVTTSKVMFRERPCILSILQQVDLNCLKTRKTKAIFSDIHVIDFIEQSGMFLQLNKN